MAQTKEHSISIHYNEIEIEYIERDNRWLFELRGRERFAESLAKAKEFIDKPEPVKKVPFVRMKAYMAPNYGSKAWRTVEVTSIAEKRYGEPEVWISEDGERKRVSVHKVFAISPENDTLINDLKNLRAEEERIDAKIDKREKALKPIVLPAE